MDDVVLSVGLDKAAGRGADGAAHVGDEEAAFRLGADLVGDGAEDGAVGLEELWSVWVRNVKVVCSVLGLEQR